MAERRSPKTVFTKRPRCTSLLLAGVAATALTACASGFDIDMRNNGSSTSQAALSATTNRPQADDRGIISYPNYQVAVAKRDDTVKDVADRVGVDAAQLASYNGINPTAALREGEVLALPTRVAEPSPATGSLTTGPLQPAETIDITSLAGDAINRAEPTTPNVSTAPAKAAADGTEPVRHKVERGETAYSVARLYGVSVKSLADWNGLGADLSVREGQYLLIPVAITQAPVSAAPESSPGEGSPTPTPPSAATALPAVDATPDAPDTPDTPNLAEDKTAASGTAALLFPVTGKVIRPYQKGKNEGIDISASAGASVKAAKDGSVAAITKDTQEITIVVLKHADNLLTVYANVDGITVKKGDKVTRGQTIATVHASDPPFLHFEVRKGFESVDPMDYLN